MRAQTHTHYQTLKNMGGMLTAYSKLQKGVGSKHVAESDVIFCTASWEEVRRLKDTGVSMCFDLK